VKAWMLEIHFYTIRWLSSHMESVTKSMAGFQRCSRPLDGNGAEICMHYSVYLCIFRWPGAVVRSERVACPTKKVEAGRKLWADSFFLVRRIRWLRTSRPYVTWVTKCRRGRKGGELFRAIKYIFMHRPSDLTPPYSPIQLAVPEKYHAFS